VQCDASPCDSDLRPIEGSRGAAYHDEALEDLAVVIGNAKTRVSLPSWTYRYLGEGSTSAGLPLSLEKDV
jgi:hypothetical protein